MIATKHFKNQSESHKNNFKELNKINERSIHSRCN